MIKSHDNLIKKIRNADKKELSWIIRYLSQEASEKELQSLKACARGLRDRFYGPKVLFRGLIEISSYCKNDCYYCGIRSSNRNAIRYRMTRDEILNSCREGYKIGFRTFVLQGGEDPYYSDEILCQIVKDIKIQFPDCAITLSLGQRSYASYKKLYEAGASRYLLRHETADKEHFYKLHPQQISFDNRIKCLYDLKEIGYQVGAGFMVGSPGQTYETLAEDLMFLRELKPHMIGIGPFIPHKETSFADYLPGRADMTVILISLIRIFLPKAMLPATAALNTIDKEGRIKGLMAGANVLMPNLTPEKYRDNYSLYDNKLSRGKEAAENLDDLIKFIKTINLSPDLSRGDHVDYTG